MPKPGRELGTPGIDDGFYREPDFDFDGATSLKAEDLITLLSSAIACGDIKGMNGFFPELHELIGSGYDHLSNGQIGRIKRLLEEGEVLVN